MGLDFNQDEKGRLIITITESLDSLNAHEVYSEVEKRIKEFSGDVVFNFENLEYISSAGLQVLLMAAKVMKGKGKDVYVRKPKEIVNDVLNVSGFYSFLKKMD